MTQPHSPSGAVPACGVGSRSPSGRRCGGLGEGTGNTVHSTAHGSQKPLSSSGFGETAWSTVVRGSTLSFLTTWRAVAGCHLDQEPIVKTLEP